MAENGATLYTPLGLLAELTHRCPTERAIAKTFLPRSMVVVRGDQRARQDNVF